MPGPGLKGLFKRACAIGRRRADLKDAIYADICSVIEIARQRSIRAIDAIRLTLNGEPLHPSQPAFI